jgi:hypothetical protein
MAPLASGARYGAPLAFATFHLYQSELDTCADWVERAVAERHPALFLFLRSHAHALLVGHRWPGVAKLLTCRTSKRRRRRGEIRVAEIAHDSVAARDPGAVDRPPDATVASR